MTNNLGQIKMDYASLARQLIRPVEEAGQVIMDIYRRRPTIDIKADGSPVTEADKAAEAILLPAIAAAAPSIQIVSEENPMSHDSAAGDQFFLVDPLDGTTNYLHGFPQYAVSIALVEKGITSHAVIYDPFKEELFTASKGEGAYLNNERIRVTSTNGLKDTLIGTGFPFKHPQHLDCYIETFRAIHPHVSGIRRAGAAALDLAYLAAGRLDGFWEIGLNSWDMAAGALMVKEAGGFIGDFSGRDKYMETGNVVAGNSDVYKQILKKIHPHLTQDLQR